MREDFEHWWDQEGQYSELCGKDLCEIAWSNGEYVAQKELTDEEIADMVCSGKYWELSEGKVIIAVHFNKFARAILRKASEK